MSMLRDPSVKYSPFPQVPLAERQWPTRTITAPRAAGSNGSPHTDAGGPGVKRRRDVAGEPPPP